MNRALVLGAGGFLGLNLVEALLKDGALVRCGRRARSNVLALRRLKAELVLADLDAPDTLRAAMDGCDVVFHLAGHYPRLSSRPDETLALGTRQMQAVLDAAASAGVRRLVYVSSTASVAPAEGGSSKEEHRYPAPPAFGAYHRVKWQMEAQVDAERRFEAVTVCPGACLGPHDWKVGTAALVLAAASGKCPPHPDGWVNPVDVRDVAALLVQVGRHPAPPRRVLAAGSTHRLQGLLERLARRHGVPPPPAPLPDAQALAFAQAEEARAEVEGGRPLLSCEIAELVVHGQVIDASLARGLLGRDWTPLDSTLDAFDDWATRMGFLTTHNPQELSA